MSNAPEFGSVDMEDVEAKIALYVSQIGQSVERYLIKKQKKWGFLSSPAALQAFAKIIAMVVCSYAPEERDNAMKEFAMVLMMEFEKKKQLGNVVEKPRIIVPTRH